MNGYLYLMKQCVIETSQTTLDVLIGRALQGFFCWLGQASSRFAAVVGVTGVKPSTLVGHRGTPSLCLLCLLFHEKNLTDPKHLNGGLCDQ